MKLKLLTPRSGLTGAQNMGDIIDVDDAEGKRMIAAGQAVEAKAPVAEKAVKAAKAERATK